jgi:uncharacterized protein (TIGR00725 family)
MKLKSSSRILGRLYYCRCPTRGSNQRRQMARKPVIAIIGSGRDIEPAVTNARKLGRLVAESGWVLISGGRDDGVMKAANEGAKKVKQSVTIGILPNREAEVSSDVDVAIVTDTGEARNNIIVLSADVVIACGVDGAGTASEISLAIKNGKPVVLLGASEAASAFFAYIGLDQISTASSPSEAIDIVNAIVDRGTVDAASRKEDK